jgi:hypothetical protein
MKKLVAMFMLATLSPCLHAVNLQNKMVLDKVVLQISAKQWATTQTALLNVKINATLTNADLVKARSDMMSNLSKIAKGDWQLIQFERSQDSSGLEKLAVVAQARVPQASLTDIYQNAKSVSKPGATYEINEVEFKPSLEEMQQAKSQLRERLYHQINDEVGRLNKIYSNQNYSVNRIIFFEGNQVMPMTKAYQAKTMHTLAVTAATPAPALTVSNEIIMQALVELASKRQEGNNAGGQV